MKTQLDLKRIIRELGRIQSHAEGGADAWPAKQVIDARRAQLRELNRREIFALIAEATKEPVLSALKAIFGIRSTLGSWLEQDDMVNFPNFQNDRHQFAENHPDGLFYASRNVPIERWQGLSEEYLRLTREFAENNQHLNLRDDRADRWLESQRKLAAQLVSEGIIDQDSGIGY